MDVKELPVKTDDAGLDIGEYLRIISRGRWWILLAFLTVLSITIYLNNKAVPVYEATVTLLSEEYRRESMSAFSGGGDSWGYFVGDKPINNKQAILKSMLVAREVARFLKKQPDVAQLSFMKNAAGNLHPNDKVARKLINRIRVSFIDNSDIISFTASGFGKNGAHEAAVIANAYGDVFYDKSFRELKSEIYEIKKFLQDQIEKYRIDLEKAEQELRIFKEREKLVALSTET